jgi:hypothetical protein
MDQTNPVPGCCAVCDGTGWLLDEVCPLCDGATQWPETVIDPESDDNIHDFPRGPEPEAAESLATGISSSLQEIQEISEGLASAVARADAEWAGIEASLTGIENRVLTGTEASLEAQPQEANSQSFAAEHNAAATGFWLLSSDGVFHLRIITPEMAKPNFTEEEVAKAGTTWTHGDSLQQRQRTDTASTADTEDPEKSEDGVREDTADACKCMPAEDDVCGICMESFDEGDQVTSLPCASHGCRSVWHLGCIHKWLNQGRVPSCPLCRKQVKLRADDVQPPPPSAPFIGPGLPLMAPFIGPSLPPRAPFIGPRLPGDDAGEGSSWLSREFMGVFLQAMMAHGVHSQGTDMPMSRLATQASPIAEQDNGVSITRLIALN